MRRNSFVNIYLKKNSMLSLDKEGWIWIILRSNEWHFLTHRLKLCKNFLKTFFFLFFSCWYEAYQVRFLLTSNEQLNFFLLEFCSRCAAIDVRLSWRACVPTVVHTTCDLTLKKQFFKTTFIGFLGDILDSKSVGFR